MQLPNLWHLFNLRSSPFFQETLSDTYPLSLFVGRQRDSDRLLRGIGSSSSSRQLIEGPPGFGKTTLAQYVKGRAADAGFLSTVEPVGIGSTESAETFLMSTLRYAYEALVTQPEPDVSDREAVQTARQLVRAFRIRDTSASVSVAGFGGGGGRTTRYVESGLLSPRIVVPALLQELLDVATSEMRADGVVLHIDNLENLSDAAREQAGRVMRDIRDVFLTDGLHTLLVGTSEAVSTLISPHPQLRSMFAMPGPLEPLRPEEFLELLDRRYAFLRLESGEPVTPPVDEEAAQEVYELFHGDLRGVLRALDEAAHELIGYGEDVADPMILSDIRSVLRPRYREEMEGSLSDATADYLMRLRELAGGRFTQADLEELWDVSRGRVSQILSDLRRYGYVQEAEREGRRIRYALTGASHMLLGTDPD